MGTQVALSQPDGSATPCTVLWGLSSAESLLLIMSQYSVHLLVKLTKTTGSGEVSPFFGKFHGKV